MKTLGTLSMAVLLLLTAGDAVYEMIMPPVTAMISLVT